MSPHARDSLRSYYSGWVPSLLRFNRGRFANSGRAPPAIVDTVLLCSRNCFFMVRRDSLVCYNFHSGVPTFLLRPACVLPLLQWNLATFGRGSPSFPDMVLLCSGKCSSMPLQVSHGLSILHNGMSTHFVLHANR